MMLLRAFQEQGCVSIRVKGFVICRLQHLERTGWNPCIWPGAWLLWPPNGCRTWIRFHEFQGSQYLCTVFKAAPWCCQRCQMNTLFKGISKFLVHSVKHSFHLACAPVQHIKMIAPGQHQVMGTKLIIPTCKYSKPCLTLAVEQPSAAASCCISDPGRGCVN